MNSVACTSGTIGSARHTPPLLRVATAAIALLTAISAHAAEQRGPGAALRFDGTNGVVLLQNPAAPFSNPSGSFTIEFWANPTALRDASAPEGNTGTAGVTGQRYAIFPDDGGNAYGASHASVGVSVGNNGIGVFARGTSYFPPLLSYNTPLNGWTHIAVVVETNRPRLYVNGTLARTGVASTRILHPSATLGDPGANYGHYQGQLDEVRIWKSGRSQSEIQGFMNTPLPTGGDGLVAYYRLDEGAGDVIGDASPNDNNGIRYPSASGFPAWTVSTAPVGVPVITTTAATSLQPASAQLNAIVQPHGLATAVWFQWGSTTNYGNTSSLIAVTNGFSEVAVAQTISNLVAGATYHFRAAASNSVGAAMGTNQTFVAPYFGPINAGLPPIAFGYGIWADMDTNGFLDIVMDGVNNNIANHDIWRNTTGTFTHFPQTMPVLQSGFAAAADIDNDGDIDLAFSGVPGISEIAQIRRNLNGTLVDAGISITPVRNGGMAWGDFDNDGRKDLAVIGFRSPNSFQADIWRNTGSSLSNINAGLPGLTVSSIAWGDYDNDGWLDLALQGGSGLAQRTEIWRNTGSGFTNIEAGLTPLMNGSVSWGDYNNDGLLDLLASGSSNGVAMTVIWQNTEFGFVKVGDGIEGTFGASTWADFDNDGVLDVMLMGSGASGVRIAQVWRNTGAGFELVPANLPGINQGTVRPGDYDRDGRVDILLTGWTGFVAHADVWRNGFPNTNTPPGAPKNLRARPTATGIRLEWDPAVDSETPSAGLSYNIRVGSAPGAANIVSPEASLDTGVRFLPEIGNAQLRRHSFVNLPPGRYYWSVQAIDTAFAGGAWAPEQSFDVGGSVFTKASRHDTNSVLLELTGYIGRSYLLQTSTNLGAASNQWQTLGTIQIGTNGVHRITNSAPAGDHRFYRAVSL